MRNIIIFSVVFLSNLGLCIAQEAEIWRKFMGEINNPEIPVLFYYSYAGYKLGERGIPEKLQHLAVFNVLDFGAIPKDTISDQEAMQLAIRAAEKNKGGIVFFPPGEFLVNVNPNKTNPITINASTIVIKGNGLGKGRTIVQMKDHMLQSFPDQPEWQVNYMFKFRSKNKSKRKTKIISNAQAGDLVIEVEDASHFQNAQYIQLEMPYNLIEVLASLDGNQIRPHWEKVKEESVNFKANFKDPYLHHNDFIHDNAWSIISMNTVASSWVSRCSFSNITGAVAMSNTYASGRRKWRPQAYKCHSIFQNFNRLGNRCN